EVQGRHATRAAAGESTATTQVDVVAGSPTGDGSASPGAPIAAGSGPERPGPAVASGPLACAAPSSAPGITDDEIAIGTINSLSGPVPGLGASHLAATQAYAAYRNATGGVCGRKVRVVAADDGADGARYR